jgi:hypothetical protein
MSEIPGVPAGGLWLASTPTTPTKGPSVADFVADLSEEAAQAAVEVVVKRTAARPPGYPVELDHYEEGACFVAGVSPDLLAVRVAEARARERDRLLSLARPALDADARLESLKRAFLSAHTACYGYRASNPAETTPRCSTECAKSRDSWRRGVEAVMPARQALAELKRLAVPADVKRRESAARAKLTALRSRLFDAKRAIGAFVFGPNEKAVNALRRREVESLTRELAQAEAEHEAAKRERARLELEAVEAVRSSSEPKRGPRGRKEVA